MSTTTSTPSPVVRLDLQALRGWAVLIVVLFHAGSTRVLGGYLGVDLFFVLSGYLMTTQITRSLGAGTFSFGEFYARRAKRLLPAAYVTIGLTLAVTPWLLAGRYATGVMASAWASLGLLANHYFLGEHGYFAVESRFEPLLHFWSLSVEEQFYLAFPLLLFLTGRRQRAWLLAIVLASLAWWSTNPRGDAPFYLLSGRAWELGIGGLAALAPRFSRPAFDQPVRAVSALILMAVPTLLFSRVTPAVAQIACVLSAAALTGTATPIRHSKLLSPLTWIGDRSYSIYLVHWPLIALTNNAWIGTDDVAMPRSIRLALVAASLVGGAVMYRFIERPLHVASLPTPRRALLLSLGAASILVSVGFVARRVGPPQDQLAERLRFVSGLHYSCAGQSVYAVTRPCETSPTPTVLLWGDSHAMQLVPALLAAQPGLALRQATLSQCPPLVGQAPFDVEAQLDQTWSTKCLAFNTAVIRMVASAPSLDVVILASPLWREVLPTKSFLVDDRRESAYPRRGGPAVALMAIRRTVDTLHRLGKRVVLVESPPYETHDTGRCLAREAMGQPILGAVDCRISRASWQRDSKGPQLLLDSVSAAGIAPVVRLADYLCRGDTCLTQLDSVLFYHDRGHLSTEGSAWLGSHTTFVQHLWSAAR